MATPRTCGRRPSQRMRPALPIDTFMWSSLPTTPIVALHLSKHHAHLARGQPQGDVVAFLGHDTARRPGGAHHLAAPAELQLDVVHVHAERDRLERQGVADSRGAPPARSGPWRPTSRPLGARM